MINIFKDTVSFLKTLSFVDVVFIMSIIGLIVLIVTLIYIIKVNDEEELEDHKLLSYTEDKHELAPVVKEEVKEDKPIEEKIEDELDLAYITQELDTISPKAIALNEYEREQEERAIISYDELLKTKDLQEDINYIKEQNLGDLTVKSVDVDSLTKPIELPKIREKLKEVEKKEKEEIKEEVEDFTPKHSKTILISYAKEEEFLQTLKALDHILN